MCNYQYYFLLNPDIHHRITYLYSTFQQNRVSKSVKIVHTSLFAQYRKLHKFAATNSNLKKSMILNMYHQKTFMYINFQQNQIKTQVITVLTSLFAKNCKLHKFPTTYNNF